MCINGPQNQRRRTSPGTQGMNSVGLEPRVLRTGRTGTASRTTLGAIRTEHTACDPESPHSKYEHQAVTKERGRPPPPEPWFQITGRVFTNTDA